MDSDYLLTEEEDEGNDEEEDAEEEMAVDTNEEYTHKNLVEK